MRREEEIGGERRVRREACGGDERGVEALAADISDRESEPRQAIVAASSCGGNSRVLENDTVICNAMGILQHHFSKLKLFAGT